MQNGVIKMWDPAKGFGFITTDDDEDLFVHLSDLHVSIKNQRLNEGQAVSFDVRRDMKGDRAINVRIKR
ncbi:MAG: cold shock domain-containing protein [Calditrichales bacterium]|nr:MAG: cold shock domain-containing protein [Calditrichales bacterium]